MPDPRLSGPLVLVVDDTPINRSVAGLILAQIGCRTVLVDSGQEALAAVLAQPIELVLMDCQMPGMDGFETAVRIRQAIVPGRRLPIIALTGHDQPSDRERSRQAGMDDHLAKPVQHAALRSVIERWIGGGQDATPAPAEAAPSTILDPAPLAAFDRLRPGSGATLLGIYRTDLVAAEAALGRGITEGDLEAVSRIAHKLKGASLTVGARALGQSMKELGQLAHAGFQPACQDGWRLAAEVLAATRAAIDASLAGAPAVRAPPWPATRASPETLVAQRARVLRSEGLVACMDAMPGPALLLNPERQIIVANTPFQQVFAIGNVASLLGKRPGEVLGCLHAFNASDGCSSHPACTFCGMVQAVMGGVRNHTRTVAEAHLTVAGGKALELEMTASPIRLEGQGFVLLAMRDIASSKRREVLERLFFHDVMNSAGGIHGLATQLAQGQVAPAAEPGMRLLLAQTAQRLVEEIQSQRQLSSAESGELQVDMQLIALAALLREVRDNCACHPSAAQRSLILGPLVTVKLRTDGVLFRRVLGNLVLNALEATPPGGTVTISSRMEAGSVRCTVHNPGMMPLVVQHQLFQRSFTTKGPGRGLGTWSAKLLGERYLGGSIGFNSDETAGTELVFSLPETGT